VAFQAMSHLVTTIEQQGRSRIRLSAGLLDALGWEKTPQEFEIYGFFRQRDELLCTPIEIADDEITHPFESLITRVSQVTSPPRFPGLRKIPPASELILPTRLSRYTATWISNREQLNISLGEEVLHTLGRTEDSSRLYAVAYGGVLILMSPNAYLSARSSEP
jgi:hypothetical protein